MYRIGLTSSGKTICKDLFKKYHEAGIAAIELCQENYSDIDYTAVKKWAQEFNIDLWSLHLPYTMFDISKPDKCKLAINRYEELIKSASEIGIKRFIVHPSQDRISDEDRPMRMKCAQESLVSLAEIARRNNAIIAVEDLPRACLGRNSDEIAELISVDKDLMVCFDTNHLLKENPIDFIHKIGNRIITTHISDYDLIDEKHWLPGEGKLDWKAIVNALKDIDYNGVWLYEIGFACPKTIIRDRDLTYEDFVRNAMEVFENKDITVLSSHKENL